MKTVADQTPADSASAQPAFLHKLADAKGCAERLAALPRPWVFTNGVFDVLHRGHVVYLALARALGGSLVLALNTDASARRLGKGPDRPLNNEMDRAMVIAALGAVDLVTWFEEDTPIERILQCRPQILVKGGDWSPEKIVGAAQVMGWGGSVHAIAFEHERSTTALLGRIRG